ncbi:uncharacterized protein LOC112433213 isoform X4 [Maylandia zebra]|uniref:uncharacterized protein LOC112433213 isoform X4 n=1 Tax=Maylandia zebra TaxID=106582 RepID=UPI00403CDE39
MDEFRWIQMFLCLMLMIQIVAGYNTVKCEVTDTDTGRVQPFTFSPQPSAEANTTKEPARKTESSTKSEPNTISNPSKSPISWYINGAIGLVALLITAVCLIIRKRMKGNKMQKNENPGLSSNPAETQTNQNSVRSPTTPRVKNTSSYSLKNCKCMTLTEKASKR